MNEIPCGTHRRCATALMRCALLALGLILSACRHAPRSAGFSYGTDNAVALAAFNRGWMQIMDEGRWTAAERSFREAADADPSFILGAALVARITTDLDERQALLANIEANLDRADTDCRLLLDVFLMNIRAMNARDEGRAMPAVFNEERRSLALRNFGAFVTAHPQEPYIQAEYIEWIHAVHGAEAALEAME
ncbi:MAG: hypothetical protein KC983_09445, partial [Phycisphaerales bacterium]|nr:hypothetical protein [Phycisphaerales bacterium]